LEKYLGDKSILHYSSKKKDKKCVYFKHYNREQRPKFQNLLIARFLIRLCVGYEWLSAGYSLFGEDYQHNEGPYSSEDQQHANTTSYPISKKCDLPVTPQGEMVTTPRERGFIVGNRECTSRGNERGKSWHRQ
jgi:hypothetical protein